MTVRIPLFPLATVLFPGVPLPLHIFEERYRLLIRELMALPPEQPRRFGVVAIREGREVGADGVRALHSVGCTAELRHVQQYDDARFDIVTVGASRFTVHEIDTSAPYFQADVEFLAEHPTAAEKLTAVVSELFTSYLAALGTARQLPIDPPDLPEDALLLSYLVAATTLLDVPDKQRLLETPDADARLRAEAELLHREVRLLRLLSAVPSPDALRAAASPN
ncbi:MAG: LON peptidase substrate-binding domain-containing protein [Actinomycetes bacterium]